MRDEKKLRQIGFDDQGKRVQAFRFSHFSDRVAMLAQ
jgi:hypothetical protein